MATRLRTSDLNREITVLHQPADGPRDARYGTPTGEWEPLSYLPGSPLVAERFAAQVVETPPGREETAASGNLALARNLVRIRIRWRNDLTAAMRVVLHGDTDRTLRIVGGPTEVGGRKMLVELLCEALSS